MTTICLQLLIVSLAAFLCGTARGQAAPQTSEGRLIGDVADKAENAPISKAFMLVHRPDGQKDVIVKVSDGRFDLSLVPGLYDVFVAASGFEPSCKKMKISQGQTAVFKARLEPDTQHLESRLGPAKYPTARRGGRVLGRAFAKATLTDAAGIGDGERTGNP